MKNLHQLEEDKMGDARKNQRSVKLLEQ